MLIRMHLLRGGLYPTLTLAPHLREGALTAVCVPRVVVSELSPNNAHSHAPPPGRAVSHSDIGSSPPRSCIGRCVRAKAKAAALIATAMPKQKMPAASHMAPH